MAKENAFFFLTQVYSHIFFPMVLCSLQEISEGTLTPPLS